MADEGLKIRVGADLSDLNKELKTAQRDMKSFGASVSKGINAGGFDDFTQKVRAIKKPTNDATRSLVDLGRIAQDAPFGFIGIANNINPALESFQRLKAESGSTGKALKSMAAGLIGPAGIGVAFSVVSSALIVLVQKYGSLSSAVTVLTSNFSQLQLAQRDVNIAFGKASADASAQLVTVKALFEIARDTALATETRSQAIKKLNADYGKYLGNLTLETINTDKVNDAQKRLNETLINQAKIKGLQSLISKETEKQANIYAEFVDKIEGGKSTIGGFLNAIKDLNPAFAGSGIKQSQLDVIGLGNEFELSEKKINLFGQALKGLLTNEATSGNLSVSVDKIKKAVKKTVDEVAKVIQEFKLQKLNIPLVFKNTDGIESLEGYKSFRKKAQDALKKDPLYVAVKVKMDASDKIDPKNIVGYNSLKKETDRVRDLIKDFNTDIKNTIQTGFSDAVSSIGETIGNIIAEGASGLNGFANIGVLLANILINVGKAAVGTGLAILGIKKALESLNPYVAIGAGIALIALGSAVKNKLSQQSTGMATGGIVPPGFENDTFPARLSSREAVIPLDKLEGMFAGNSGGGTLSTRVSGNDLVFILERTKRSQGRSF